MPNVTANGLTLEYESLGDPSHPPLVLVMGLGAQLLFWPDELCDALVAHGFHVVRFDNRDVGLSSVLDHLGTPNIALASLRHLLRLPVHAPYRIDDMATDTLGLLDALGLARVHLVGASMGGMIAQNVAARAPDRVASLVSIMSTTGSRNLPPPTLKARSALLAPPARRGDFEGGVRRMMHLLRVIGSKTHPAPDAWLRAFCERHVRRHYDPAGVARQLVAIAASGDRTSIVRTIHAPTLVLHGDEDPLLRPRCGEATARAIVEGGGDARLETVRGMGHDFPLPLIERIAGTIEQHCRRIAP
jgi:proline iminopeptidase